jgi:hypothetical protein
MREREREKERTGDTLAMVKMGSVPAHGLLSRLIWITSFQEETNRKKKKNALPFSADWTSIATCEKRKRLSVFSTTLIDASKQPRARTHGETFPGHVELKQWRRGTLSELNQKLYKVDVAHTSQPPLAL